MLFERCLDSSEKKNQVTARERKKCGVSSGAGLLADNAHEDMLLLNIEANDIEEIFMVFGTSTNLFDKWFIEQMKENTDVDFSQYLVYA